ncbi:MAG: photosynthetic complex putative assembly protein PuhB [Myxococcota bacterium]
MNEFEYEEVPGLPGKLPPGESILWQGAPDWRALARRTFHVRAIAIYFALLVVARGAASIVLDNASLLAAIGSAIIVVPLAFIGLAILYGLAWWHARTTVYTITDRRVVMRFGIAVQLAINLPFREIKEAALLELPDGYGEIPLTLGGTGRLAYLHLWPHARPGLLRHPQPMMRCVHDGQAVAKILTEAWADFHQTHQSRIELSPVVEAETPTAGLQTPAEATG